MEEKTRRNQYKLTDYYDHAINGIVSTSTSPLGNIFWNNIFIVYNDCFVVQGLIFLFVNNDLISGGTL